MTFRWAYLGTTPEQSRGMCHKMLDHVAPGLLATQIPKGSLPSWVLCCGAGMSEVIWGSLTVDDAL